MEAVLVHYADSGWLLFAAIILGSFISEDGSCLAVGLLASMGIIDFGIGLLACFLGIFLGDLGVYGLGRLSRLGLRRLWFADLPAIPKRTNRLNGTAILASRFLPGTRVPLYFAMGGLGYGVLPFLFWTIVACLLWTPIAVSAATIAGTTLHQSSSTSSNFFDTKIVVVIAVLVGWRVLRSMNHPIARAKLRARISRIWRWEFWPTWLFYLPLAPWLLWLAIRHRSLLVWTAANPGIPHGGLVGESKSDILNHLPSMNTIPSLLIPEHEPARTKAVANLCDTLARANQVSPTEFGEECSASTKTSWIWPIVLKPDAGQRGAGFRVARSEEDVVEYLKSQSGPVIAQQYHPGPYEAGIFYYREPTQSAGKIFSITDKRFAILVGDGKHTLEESIWMHPRFRMQSATFLKRHESCKSNVLAKDEQFVLARAGNHCQGTMFLDGSHLLTPALEMAVDRIAKEFQGFFIGRFDVRYSDIDDFKAGKDISIVELNGATSESTNIYDPSWSLFRAYRTLARQWSLLFRIGSENQKTGAPVTKMAQFVQIVSHHLFDRAERASSD